MKKTFVFLFGVFVTFVLGSCNLPSTEMNTYGGSGGSPSPIPCPRDVLQNPATFPPQLVNPEPSAMVSDSPILSVTYSAIAYPYPSPAPAFLCYPNHIHFYLSTGPGFTDEIGGMSHYHSALWATPRLEEGKTYRWAAAAVSKSVEGIMSPYRYFVVGSRCAASALLVPPVLLEPADKAVIEELSPKFIWSNSLGCFPEKYIVEISTDSSFTDVKDREEMAGSSTYYQPSFELLDLLSCKTYYWRVQVEKNGPFSETRSFIIQRSGENCPIEADLQVPEALLPPDLVGPPPIFQGIKNANCRSNPWVAGNEVGFIAKGDMVTLLGVNDARTWGFLRLDNGRECWANLSLLEIQPPGSIFDPSAYPTIAHDAPPEPTSEQPIEPTIEPTSEQPIEPTIEPTLEPTLEPIFCYDISDEESCNATSVCVWNDYDHVCIDN